MVDQEQLKRNENIISDKCSISPVLGFKRLKPLRKGYPESDILKSPDLSQSARSRVVKNICFSNLKPSPDINLKLPKDTDHDSELQRSAHNNFNLSDSKTNRFKELELKQINNVIKQFDKKREIAMKSKEICKIEQFKSASYNFQLKSSEIGGNPENKCKSVSPNLSFRKNKLVIKTELTSSRKLIRKNLFSDSTETKNNENPKTFKYDDKNSVNLEDVDKNSIRANSVTSDFCVQNSFKNCNQVEIDLQNKEHSEAISDSPDHSRLILRHLDRSKFNEHSLRDSEDIGRKENMWENVLSQNETCNRRYGILPVILKKSKTSEEKKIDNLNSCVGCQLNNQCTGNKIATEHVNNNKMMLPVSSLKTPKETNFDSDEDSLTISEVSSPEKEPINMHKKPMSQVKTKDCHKLWSFNKDDFDSVFGVSNSHKNINLRRMSNVTNSSCKERIVTSLSERYEQLRCMIKKPVEDKFEISDASSESSPEQEKNLRKTNLIRRDRIGRKPKHLKKKSIIAPTLELEISSQKPFSKRSVRCLDETEINQNINDKKKFNNEEQLENQSTKILLCDNNEMLQNTTPSKSQISELVIEPVTSPSNSGNNGTPFEIEFSDASSLNPEPRTPPPKFNLGNQKEIATIDSTSKKRKKKYPDDSLIGRLWTVRNRFESNSNMLQHMLIKKDIRNSNVNLPVFVVSKILKAYSKIFVACCCLNDIGSRPSESKVELSDSYTVRNELYILADAMLFTTVNIAAGIHLKIHPPWKIFDDPETNFTMVIGPSCLEVLAKPSVSSSLIPSAPPQIQENSKTCTFVTTNFNCCCHQDFIKNPDCHYEFSDELFAEVFCPPPSNFSNPSKNVNSKRIPKLYFDANNSKGKIGHARAFNLFNPIVDVTVAVITTSQKQTEILKHGKLLLMTKDLAEEIGIVILTTQTDVDKWNSASINLNVVKQLFKISGLKFTRRLPLQRCKEFPEVQLASLVQQNYIYCLSPASDLWNVVVENI